MWRGWLIKNLLRTKERIETQILGSVGCYEQIWLGIDSILRSGFCREESLIQVRLHLWIIVFWWFDVKFHGWGAFGFLGCKWWFHVLLIFLGNLCQILQEVPVKCTLFQMSSFILMYLLFRILFVLSL